MLQVCCKQLHARLHFLQLDGPELDTTAAAALQPDAAAAAAAADTSALQQCIAACAPNATFDQCTAGGLLAGQWCTANNVLISCFVLVLCLMPGISRVQFEC
jgi:hypothetical protein